MPAAPALSLPSSSSAGQIASTVVESAAARRTAVSTRGSSAGFPPGDVWLLRADQVSQRGLREPR